MTTSSVLGQLFGRAQQLAPSAIKTLVVLDENALEDIRLAAQAFPSADYITNRWDIYLACQELKLHCTFNDFDFLALTTSNETQSYDICVYRISKERAVSHHILNQCFQRTKKNGYVIVGGRKNEGIKSYYDKSRKVFPCQAALQKNGEVYLAEFTGIEPDELRLDDKNYTGNHNLDIPLVFDKDTHIPCVTKPGAYGWNKIDQGSAYLIDVLTTENKLGQPKKILDLGCGFGYLSIQALHYFLLRDYQPELIAATDNNAAAIHCCNENLNSIVPSTNSAATTAIELTPKLEVTADDCGSQIQHKFDLILCNPPFHQGFDTSKNLTEKFIHTTKRLLSNNGIAYFVVNSFIGLESIAKNNKLHSQTLANNKQFKVIALTLA